VKARVNDSVELLVDVPAEFSDAVVIPKGTVGTIVEAYETVEGDNSYRIYQQFRPNPDVVVVDPANSSAIEQIRRGPPEIYAVDVAIPDSSWVTGFKYNHVMLGPEQFRLIRMSRPAVMNHGLPVTASMTMVRSSNESCWVPRIHDK